VETAVAFGAGCGLPEQWLRELLRFAPQPHVLGLARERKPGRGWKPRLDRGYPEYCAALNAAATPQRITRKARAGMMAALRQARGRRLFVLEGKGIAKAASAITNIRPGESSQPPLRPRTARR
jgi:hypothetical protein